MKNAVQPDRWYDALPRPQYDELEKVFEDGWFQVYRLPHDTFAICEPFHFQEVISFLITGSERAVLLDTGLGIGDIKAVAKRLTTLAVTVINSHCHFDHIGGNHLFAEGFIFPSHPSRERAKRGLPNDAVKGELMGDAAAAPYPSGFDPRCYEIEPFPHWKFLYDRQRFNLGGRELEVLFTPGHSPDSLMLADHVNRMLFTGDTVYPATLYSHLTSDDGMVSDAGVYRETMEKIAAEFADFTLVCSHNEPLRAGGMLAQVATAFAAIEDRSVPFETDLNGLRKYTFDGFSVITT